MNLKSILIITFMFLSAYPKAQTIEDNLNKYWHYRDRLEEKYMIVGMPEYTDEQKRIMFRTRTAHRIIEKFVSNKYPVDGAPGGYRNTMKAFEDSNNEHFNARHFNHAFIPAISTLALNTNDYFYNFGADTEEELLSKTPFDMVYFPTGNIEDINQEHVWISFETANNITDEFVPNRSELDGHDQQQSKMQALTSYKRFSPKCKR